MKRLFDVSASLAVGALALPVFPLMALGIKLSSKGPVFFIQERAGYHRRPFRMIKLRTMTVAPAGPQALRWNQDDVSRTTIFGGFLRDYGLDELPQVVNILRGEMSIIGPRPPLPAQVEQYEPWQLRMFDMRPGVLSLAAIKGRRAISPEERITYHVAYVDDWSLGIDLEILIKSFFVVLGRQAPVDRLDPEKPTTAPGVAE